MYVYVMVMLVAVEEEEKQDWVLGEVERRFRPKASTNPQGAEDTDEPSELSQI